MDQNAGEGMEKERNETKVTDFNNTCFFPLVLFILLATGVVLAIVGFAKLGPFSYQHGSQLCKHLPTRKECMQRPQDPLRNETVLSTAEQTFFVLIYITAVCIILQFAAIVVICSRIFTCAKVICVKLCYSVWKNSCIFCGLKWIFIDGFAGLLCLSGCIAVGAVLTVDEVREIDGFLHCLMNGIFGIVKFGGALLYHWKIGCPPNDTFLGSNINFEDVAIGKQPVAIDSYQVDRYGNRKYTGTTWRTDHSLHVISRE